MFKFHVYFYFLQKIFDKKDYYSQFFFHSFCLQDRLECDEIFLVFSTKRLPGKRNQMIAKGPPFRFLLFERNIQNWTRLKGHPSYIFWPYEFFSEHFLSPKGPLFDVFEILQQTGVSKSPKAPFYIFRHYETVPKFSFFVRNFVLNIYSQISAFNTFQNFDIKRYIRYFDVISELYCVLLKIGRKFTSF